MSNLKHRLDRLEAAAAERPQAADPTRYTHEQILAMSPEERRQLHQELLRWPPMTPAEIRALHAAAHELAKLPPEELRRLHREALGESIVTAGHSPAGADGPAITEAGPDRPQGGQNE
jgi:hypothetical protein